MKVLTQKELNSVMFDMYKDLKSLGIELGDVKPNVRITKAKSFYAVVRYREGQYEIAISKYFLANDLKDIEEVFCHELLHTVEGCMNHGEKWQSLASRVNKELGYNITRTSSLEFKIPEGEIRRVKYRYALKCLGCDNIIRRQRRSKIIKQPGLYRCSRCGGDFESIEL